nr:immunoglobulin heavy chain junction region [Mus musculus]NSM04464.1 immunoglobulin heavy chain junction region [Mus musculus]NSM07152.1 immunoglobulin heavy chain junction region [Mus musculus]NSM07929.1 immunoglobulin heavy chain junction region [Mus musculus]NSM08100.1 immunoglobulin heavy chain junction region [Mus musculus]
CAVLTFDYW